MFLSFVDPRFYVATEIHLYARLKCGWDNESRKEAKGSMNGSLWGPTPSKYLVHLKPIIFMEPIARFNESTPLKIKLKVLSLE